MFPISNLEELVSNIEVYREIDCVARLVTSEGPAYTERRMSGIDTVEP